MTAENIAELLHARARAGGGWTARCPAHDDQSPSLSITEGADGRTLLKCFTGCTVLAITAAAGISERDLFPNVQAPQGLTLTAYAAGKKLPEDFLRGLGLRDDSYKKKPAVLIPYYDAAGNPAAKRFRIALKGTKEKFRWATGTKLLPYGLNLLGEARKAGHITLVEGESCAQTLWYHDIPALGIPGADAWRDDWAECLADIPVIHAVIEPGKGGDTFRSKLLRSPVSDRLRIICFADAKDTSELYLRNSTGFPEAWAAATRSATVTPTGDGAAVLRDVVRFIRRFVWLSEAQAVVIALWVLHTHTFDVADTTPYLSITSAEKQSGKTRALEVLDLLVKDSWFTSRVSAAVLVRKVAAERPTLLLDESDAAFAGEKEYVEALRGLLNSGHRRCGKVSLCVKKGANIGYEDFPTFSPKAIAGIGSLPDTIADRSIPIRLKRRAKNEKEKIERFRSREIPALARPIHDRLAAWAGMSMAKLREAAPPELPASMSDRQQDGAEPLVMIADLIAGEWPGLVRGHLLLLFEQAGAAGAADSIGTRLLADVKAIFDSLDTDKIFSKGLCEALAGIETSPWPEFSHGKPLSPVKLAKLLASYGITPGSTRIGEDTAKGYSRDAFADAWARYLPEPPPGVLTDLQNVTMSQPAPDAGSVHFSGRHTENPVTPPNVPKTASNGPCDGVTFQSPDSSSQRESKPQNEVVT